MNDIISIIVLNDHINSFLLNYAEEIWRLIQDGRRTAKEEIKELKQGLLEAPKEKIENLVGCSKETKTQVFRALENDKGLLGRLKKFEKTGDFQYFVKSNPRGDAWVYRETSMLEEIRTLYRETFPDNRELPDEKLSLCNLLDRAIISNMAIVFHKLQSLVWPDFDTKPISTIYDRIRKRLQRYDERKNKVDLFDPVD